VITVKDFMETVDYRITEGSEYQWSCYGSNAYSLDSWTGHTVDGGYTISIIFDRVKKTVYEAAAYDYQRNRAYRLINPEFKQLHDNEALARGVDAGQAWDDVNFVDLETDQDFLDKARAIVAGEDYDIRVEVPLELSEETLFGLMQMAHQQDITLNQLVEKIIRLEIDRLEDQRITEELTELEREVSMYVDLPDLPDLAVRDKKKKKSKK